MIVTMSYHWAILAGLYSACQSFLLHYNNAGRDGIEQERSLSTGDALLFHPPTINA